MAVPHMARMSPDRPGPCAASLNWPPMGSAHARAAGRAACLNRLAADRGADVLVLLESGARGPSIPGGNTGWQR